MATVPTPQAGCFVAYYPNPVWQKTPCVGSPPATMTVGDGNDEVAKESSGNLIGTVLGVLSASGVKSEADSDGAKHCGIADGANCYSLQINTNGKFPVTYFGVSTLGFMQFVYSSAGASGNCGTATCGKLWIEYWLHDYHEDYGSCPSQEPGAGGGWFTTGNKTNPGKSCIFNLNGVLTPSMQATNLSGMLMWASANSYSPSQDEVGLCIPDEGCYATSNSDAVLDLSQNWLQSEFNIFGFNDASQAVFNSGTTINVVNILQNPKGEPFGTIPCTIDGPTAETNNLNLGSCGPATLSELPFASIGTPTYSSVTGISFTESN